MIDRKTTVKKHLWPNAALVILILFCGSCRLKPLQRADKTPSSFADSTSTLEQSASIPEDDLMEKTTVCSKGVAAFFHCAESVKKWFDEPSHRPPAICPQNSELPLVQYWLGNKHQPSEKTTAWVCYDQQFLCFYVVMDDSDILTGATENDQKLWSLGDTVEFFIKPDLTGQRYYEIHISPNGMIMDICIPSRQKMKAGKITWQEMITYNSKSKMKVEVFPEKAGWAVKLCIPWEAFELNGTPEPVSTWQFAVCRYNYFSARKKPELSSTAYLSVLDFHRYEDYHSLIF